MEAELAPVKEFLDVFNLMGQQLEFVSAHVAEAAAILGDNVTNWCAADYGSVLLIRQMKYELGRSVST